jgi:hypothetical protein
VSTRPLLTGAFLQLNASHDTEPADRMRDRLVAMRAIGLDLVIVQYCAYNGVDLGVATERVFDAAESLGMRVWLGLPFDDSRWWQMAWSPFYLAAFEQPASWAAFEAVKRYADRPGLAGAYIPYETNGLSLPWAMGHFYGAIARACKRAKPGLPVMISPFTNLVPGEVGALPPVVLAGWWDVALGKACVDVLAWQDGVGACEAQLGQISPTLDALIWATRKHGVRLWADAEAFLRTTPLDQPFAATAAPWDRFRAQIEAEAPWVERLVAFDFNDYMDPAAGPDQAALYEAYQGYRATFA